LNNQESNDLFKQSVNRRNPETNIDFNMEMINPDWKNAKPNLSSSDLSFIKVDEAGQLQVSNVKPGTYVNVDDLMADIDFFPRDIRLSNYDKQDIVKARWFASFGGDMISAGFFRAFRYCFKEVAVLSETSQGRGGWLRTKINTLRSENEHKIIEPKNKSWLTGKSKEGGN
jgi:hypothetical protein